MRLLKQKWIQILAGGILLFVGAEQGLKFTGNFNLIPTVILVGALVVPVAFVAYFFSAERSVDKQEVHGDISITLVTLSFFVGGAIGVLAAGIIEYSTLKHLTAASLFGVATIEESAKLIVPLVIFAFASYRSRADGLLFGVATGMGFAALETMGYGLVGLMNSQGNVSVLEEILLVRGLLSPVGHAAWTGLVCSVLWGTRQRTGRPFGVMVILAFALVIVLHALWDIVGTASSPFAVYTGYIIIGGTSILLIIRQLSSARRPRLIHTGGPLDPR
jgi:RsiW-degrading membrane proteinase PrsW (M82 family)